MPQTEGLSLLIKVFIGQTSTHSVFIFEDGVSFVNILYISNKYVNIFLRGVTYE